MANNIKKYKKIVEENFDYVGESFTEEAKKIKYGEKKERPIYGEATAEQTKELVEEEISVVPLPWASTKKINQILQLYKNNLFYSFFLRDAILIRKV